MKNRSQIPVDHSLPTSWQFACPTSPEGLAVGFRPRLAARPRQCGTSNQATHSCLQPIKTVCQSKRAITFAHRLPG